MAQKSKTFFPYLRRYLEQINLCANILQVTQRQMSFFTFSRFVTQVDSHAQVLQENKGNDEGTGRVTHPRKCQALTIKWSNMKSSPLIECECLPCVFQTIPETHRDEIYKQSKKILLSSTTAMTKSQTEQKYLFLS